jgi:transmembrane sensor
MPLRTESIRDQAAAWTTLLESGAMSAAELENFHLWLEEPANARVMGEFRTLLALIQDLPEHKAAALHALPLPQVRFPALTPSFVLSLRFLGVAVATIAAVVLGAWLGLRPVREFVSQTYSTETGEERTVVLPDGSVAHLNTQSRIRWIGSSKDRRLALERGEVLFEVAHDVTRPFCVTVANSEIRDLATEFDVYRKSNGSVIVTVLRGEVEVKDLGTGGARPAWAQRQLKPNEQIEYTPAAVIADVHPFAAPKSVRWREGLLETEGQSFAAVVSELNRYSTKQILLADPRLESSDIRIGGTLGIHDVRAALQRIQKLGPIVVTDTGDSYVLTYGGDASLTERSNGPRQDAAGQP